MRTYHEGLKPTRKTGTFYFGGNRNFLLWSDTMGSARLRGLSIGDNLVTMSWRERDSGAEVLLDLDGQVFVVDANGGYWVQFSVNRVASTPERPHGLKYSLTLHGPDSSRLIGFDNAHPVREAWWQEPRPS